MSLSNTPVQTEALSPQDQEVLNLEGLIKSREERIGKLETSHEGVGMPQATIELVKSVNVLARVGLGILARMGEPVTVANFSSSKKFGA
jgi:hypothetical protein